MSEFDLTLDLTNTDADTIGFPAIPSGSYEGTIAKELEWRKTDNPNGKLPVGTPFLNIPVQINRDEEPRELPDGTNVRVGGSYVWTGLYIPPADYDPTKRANMLNRVANFLKAIGEDATKKNVKFPEVDDMIGRDVTVVVKRSFNKRVDDWQNDIQGFKPAGSSQTDDDSAGLLR